MVKDYVMYHRDKVHYANFRFGERDKKVTNFKIRKESN